MAHVVRCHQRAASQGPPVVAPDSGMIDAATRRLVRERAGHRCEDGGCRTCHRLSLPCPIP